MRTALGSALAVAGLMLAGASGAQAQTQTHAGLVLVQLETMREHYDGFTLENYIIGHLAQGRADSWSFGFTANTKYVITGACDGDCSDLDIIVKDEAGNVVAKDDLDDDVPIATLETKEAGKYTVHVYMYTCETKTCYFGFGLMKSGGVAN